MHKRQLYTDCLSYMKGPIGIETLYQLLEGLFIITSASFLGEFSNAIFEGHTEYAMENIKYLLVWLMIYALVLPALGFWSGYYCIRKGTFYIQSINTLFFEKDYTKAKKLKVGEISYRLEYEIIDFYCNIIRVLSRGLTLPIIMLYAAYKGMAISVTYMMIVIALSLIQFVIPIATRKLQARYDQEKHIYQESVNHCVTEMATRPYMIRLLGIDHYFIDQLDERFKKYFKEVSVKAINCEHMATQINQFVNLSVTVVAIYIGAVFVAQERIEVGSIVAMVGFLGVFSNIIHRISYMIKTVPTIKNNAERMVFFYEDHEQDGIKIGQDHLCIQTMDLSMQYEGSDKYIPYSDVMINAGEKVMIQGKNGSGKTTLINLLCHFEEGYTGKILINGKELRHIDIHGWYKALSVLSQNPYFFKGTVIENIAISNTKIPKTKIIEYMNVLDIGYLHDKSIGFGATELSGGEKQKIAIIRAILKEAPLLILDEPSNHLDQKAIEWMKDFIKHSKKTVIMISHLEEMVESVEKIIVL